MTMKLNWLPANDGPVITVFDSHAAGEPLRVIVEGLPDIPGTTILEKRQYALEHLDEWRTGLMWEPRGHADMYGAILTEPVTSDGDLGVLFCHNEGFSTMCGHGIIALTTVVLETGIMKADSDDPELRIDTPAGRVVARARWENNRVKSVSFRNVPSFAYKLDRQLEVPGIGNICFDIAFGGAFYVFCRAADMGLKLEPGHFQQLIQAGRDIKRMVARDMEISHPHKPDLGFLYGTIFVGDPENPSHHSRNVCIFADGEVDRSPTGTGISARAALEFQRGNLKIGERITIESILGTCFDVRVLETAKAGSFPAVIPEVSGSAYLVGKSQFAFAPDDPLKKGFIFR
jgi:trans-L-3-hydroxyproline dehydratase